MRLCQELNLKGSIKKKQELNRSFEIEKSRHNRFYVTEFEKIVWREKI
jgi:hypothetical protein